MIITGINAALTGDAFIVAVARGYLQVVGGAERLGEFLAQMPYFRRTFPAGITPDAKGNVDLTEDQERYLFNASIRIGMPYLPELIATVTDRDTYSDEAVAGGLRYVELNPMLASVHPAHNSAVLEGCRNVHAWLQMAN